MLEVIKEKDGKYPVELSGYFAKAGTEEDLAYQFLVNYLNSDDPDECDLEHFSLGFDFDVNEDGLQIGREDNIDIDMAAIAAQSLLVFFDLADPVLIEVAHNCDKLRPRSHSGTAAFVTKDSIDWMSTSGWLESKLREYNAQ